MIPLSCAIVAVTACAAADAVSPERIYAIADAVRAWPEYYNAAALPDEDRDSLDAMLALPPEALDILVASDDPRHRSLAVHLANCRGDIERLRSWKHLLNDEARGFPDAGYSNAPGDRTTDAGRRAHYIIIIADQPPPVADAYGGAYFAWFGRPRPRVLSPSDPGGFDLDTREAAEYPVNDQTDLSTLVQPWVRRLELARGTEYSPRNIPSCLNLDPAVVLDQIKALEPSLRWGVIVRAEQTVVMESAEAQQLLSELPQATVQAINSGERLLTADPAYAHPNSEVPLRARFMELVEEDPPPTDPE